MKLTVKRIVLTLSLAAVGVGAVATLPGAAADEPGRKVTKRVAAAYPDLARKFQLKGTVRLTALVAGAGNVTDTEVVGGPPIFIGAAQRAAKQWVFQAGSASRELLVFVFAPE